MDISSSEKYMGDSGDKLCIENFLCWPDRTQKKLKMHGCIINTVTTDALVLSSKGCFTKVLQALQSILLKCVYCRNHMSYENFELTRKWARLWNHEIISHLIIMGEVWVACCEYCNINWWKFLVSTLNMLNWFENYKRCIHISDHTLDFVQQKSPDSQTGNPTCCLSILSIPFLLMPWRLKKLGHQQSWYWPNKPEYSISSIRRAKLNLQETSHNSIIIAEIWDLSC